MALVKDIILDDNYDIKIVNGDFNVSASDNQHLALITVTNTGQWKENPFVGLGMSNNLGSNLSASEIKSQAQQQYEADGYTIHSITIVDNEIYNVDAERLGS